MSEVDALHAIVLAQQKELSDLREEYKTWIPNHTRYECYVEPTTHTDGIAFGFHKTCLDNTCALLTDKTKHIFTMSFPRNDLFCWLMTSDEWVIGFHTETFRKQQFDWLYVYGHDLVIQYHPHRCRDIYNCKQTFSLHNVTKSWRVSRAGLEVLCRTLYETYATIDAPSAAKIAKLCAHFEIELA